MTNKASAAYYDAFRAWCAGRRIVGPCKRWFKIEREVYKDRFGCTVDRLVAWPVKARRQRPETDYCYDLDAPVDSKILRRLMLRFERENPFPQSESP